MSEETLQFIRDVEDGYIGKVRRALKRNPELVHARNDYGATPLHRAAVFAQIEVVRLLLAFGANANATDHRRSTPLHFACHDFYDSIPVMKLLLDAGAQMDARDNYWCSALMTAANYSNLPAVSFLLAQGARIDFRDRHGRTALDIAIWTHDSIPRTDKYFEQLATQEVVIFLLRQATNLNHSIAVAPT
ncbi:MAG: ankyrin repeat domain-containing protein [Armatimonadetes bacterium]|nr:ankyrin repeat domain-containing protein [Armatimonadota bacterium]